ncbi:ParB/RepB/Spo0J family partition protein [Streptomyces sp. NPDC102402]|uniref:ParB/RepB/Spo0J family partition protein n=1 Tax=Streptomyces sp. NPDC102402 TaxID=3366169 RepID=UPI0038123C8E
MSKASKLGTGTSFGQTQTISARRSAINAVTAAPTEGAPPPLKLPVEVISLNPDNPRTQLGELTELGASLRDHGQKTAISIMSRFAYLEGNPGREEDLEPHTKYVAIDGNSRLAASREAGLTEIKVMLDDELGADPDGILESALVANIHRQDLDPLDEAKALSQLLKVHGTQDALAARLHRSQGWVSQRLALLGLTPDLKQKLQSGEESAALLRRVGKKKPEEQEQHLKRLKEQGAQQAADVKQLAKQRSSSGQARGENKKPEGTARATPGASPEHYAVISSPDADETAQRDGHSPTAGSPRQDQLPSHDPEALSELIIAELDVAARRKLTELLVDYKIKESLRMRTSTEQAP